MKTSTKDVIIENFERPNRRRRAHVRGSGGNFHFVVVSAVPREYYFGSTVNTIGGTIGGGVGLLLVISCMHHRLHDARAAEARRRLAPVRRDRPGTSPSNLVLYNTEDAALVPSKKAALPTIFDRVANTLIDEETGDGSEQEEATRTEEKNYANQELDLGAEADQRKSESCTSRIFQNTFFLSTHHENVEEKERRSALEQQQAAESPHSEERCDDQNNKKKKIGRRKQSSRCKRRAAAKSSRLRR